MTDVVAPQQAASSPAKKAVAKKPKNPRAKPSHPPTSEMVNGAIKSLKERQGSSLQAIKKYFAANYKVDAEKMAPFIKKYLKAAVASGALVQTKGKGASGKKTTESAVAVAPKAASRKVPKAKSPKRAAATVAAATTASTKTTNPATDRKTAAATKAKKPAVEKKAAAAAAKPKFPSKAKRATKGSTKKPKAPKPRTSKKIGGAAPKGTPKKAASPAKM